MKFFFPVIIDFPYKYTQQIVIYRAFYVGIESSSSVFISYFFGIACDNALHFISIWTPNATFLCKCKAIVSEAKSFKNNTTTTIVILATLFFNKNNNNDDNAHIKNEYICFYFHESRFRIICCNDIFGSINIIRYLEYNFFMFSYAFSDRMCAYE